MNEIILRDYQKDIIDSINKSYERGIKRQLVVAATGLGKSVVLVHFMLEQTKKGKRILLLVDQEDLVWQWKKYFVDFAPNINLGVEKAEFKAKKTDQIVIASVQTLGRKGIKRIKRFKPNHFDLCCIDEADKSITKQWFRVLEYFGFGKDNFLDKNLLCGTTATPWRESGEAMGILYDDIVANYDTRYAIREGWLVDMTIHSVNTTTDISEVKSTNKEFVGKSLSEAVNTEQRNTEVVKAYQDICPGEQALVYAASVDHAYVLCELFNHYNIRSVVVEANTDKKERKEYLEAYRQEDIKAIINHSTMVRGIDLPETSSLLLTRPIKSKNLMQQILGRSLRPSFSAFVDMLDTAEDRKKAIETSIKPFSKIIDFYDKNGKHEVAHVPSLFGLHNQLRTKKPKKFYTEVVEPLEKEAKDKGIDISNLKDPDDIKLIVKNRDSKITSLRLSTIVERFTNRLWTEISNGYEIFYDQNNKKLIVEKDRSKAELINKTEWCLLEFDTKEKTTKYLQTFQSLAGAFKIADEYADEQKWSSKYLQQTKTSKAGVTKKQFDWITKLYKYKTGRKEYRILNERYEDTGMPKLLWKDTNEIIDRQGASKLLKQKFNK